MTPATPESERREAALRKYVSKRMTPTQFAKHIRLSYSSAVRILRGEMWKDTERPERFRYPWPERMSQSTSIRNAYSREEIAEAVALKKAEGWSYRQLAAYMGVTHATTYRWENGETRQRIRSR
jgi:transposase